MDLMEDERGDTRNNTPRLGPASSQFPPPSAGSPSSGNQALSPSTSGPPTGPTSGASKRKRGIGIVTPNACTECRKKRAKVSGAAFYLACL